MLPAVRPADMVDADDLRDVHAWVDHISREVVDGPGRSLFPVVGGTHLGDMARLELQTYLFDFALVARSIIKLADAAPIASASVLAAERDRARALASLLGPGGRGVRIRWVPLVRMIRGVRARLIRRIRAVRPNATALPPALRAAAARGISVLTVSETSPMAETFAAVERHLDTSRCGPVVRVQFGNASASAGGVDVIPLGRPGVIDPARTGRFAAAWAAARGRAATLDVRGPLGGRSVTAPLMTILQRLFVERFDVMAEQLEYAAEVLDAVGPSVLLVGNDRWYVSLAFVEAARRRGIPSVCVQDGIATDAAYWRWIGADMFVASSEEVAEILRLAGVAEERVAVSGQPRYDRLFEMRGRSGSTAREELGISEGGPVVLFATQPHQSADYTADVTRAILQVPGTRLLLRPHPAEPAGRYEAYAAEHGPRVSLATGRDLPTTILAADLVVIESSTVGLEAILLGRPVVTANFAGTPTLVPYAERRLARRARHPAELTALIAEALAGPAPDDASGRALERFAGPFDGRAGARAADVVTRIAEGNHVLPPAGLAGARA